MLYITGLSADYVNLAGNWFDVNNVKNQLKYN